MPEALCPSCDENIRFSRVPKLGQKVTCPECGERLEVVYLDPIELDYEDDSDFEDDLDWDDEPDEF
jgi:lysine biosynthesis protein LysW